MNKLTVVVLTKNEQDNIEECLKGLGFADEIIVVDDNSVDRTIEFAKKYNAKIFKKNFISFSEKRNFGLREANNEWVLFVDADEIISDALSKEIDRVVVDSINDAFLIKREDIFLGKKMRGGDIGNIWLLRLGKKTKGRWVGDVHEQWEIKGKISKLKNPLVHKSHDNISDFISKINYYSSLRSSELRRERVESSFLNIIFYPLGKFIVLFFIKKGFVDGLYGFVHAIFMSFYSFLVRAKLYQLNNGKNQ